MPTKAVELRPDRRKIKTTFDGYKLNLEPLPVLRFPIAQSCGREPEQVRASSDKHFSFLHAELFGLHNHLFRDAWHPNSAYFIDASWTIQKVSYDGETGKVRPFTPVMKVLRPSAGSGTERYPMSLEFVSEKWAVVGDGLGTLIVVDTGNRGQSDEFKAKQRFEMEGGPFVVRSVQLNEEEKEIGCVLVRVAQAEEHFETVGRWVKFRCAEGIWALLDEKVLKTRSSLHYCGLEKDGNALLVATEFPVDFVTNLEKQEVRDAEEKEDVEKMEKELSLYTWSQTEEDVTINFEPQEDATKQDYEVKVTKDAITVKFKSEVLLTGTLFAPIDVDITTWTIQNNFLQVLLNKETPVTWPFLIPGSPDPQEGTETDIQETPFDTIVDECENPEKENYLSRLTWLDEETTHQVYLGTTGPLFSVALSPNVPKAVALKHDVDACIWQHKSGADWTHEDTIDAFAYVLASKQQRKFVEAAPNAEYVVIAEAERHIFIYKKGYQGSNLRNRTGVPVNIGQQKLVTLDGLGEIIGISVENDVTLLLTPNFVVCLQMKIEE